MTFSRASPVSTIFLFPVVGFLASFNQDCARRFILWACLPYMITFLPCSSAHRQAFGLRLVKAQFGRGSMGIFIFLEFFFKFLLFFFFNFFYFFFIMQDYINSLSFSSSLSSISADKHNHSLPDIVFWRIYFCAIAKPCNVFS